MIGDLLFRLRALFRRKSMETALDEELRSHLDRQAEKYEKSGLPREESLRRAQIDLGGLDQAKEECRESWGVRFLESMVQDVRSSLRQLRSQFSAI